MAKKKAKESPQIVKARLKIERQLAQDEKRINPADLEKMSLIIKRQIARYKNDRIDLKSRNIVPTAVKPENKFVLRMIRQLKQTTSSSENNLEGRITNVNES